MRYGLPSFGLLGGNNAHYANVQLASDMRRGVHQDHHIQWIAIVAQRGWHEAEIEWKQHTLRQQPTELEESGLGIIRKLVPRSFRRLDDRQARPTLRVQSVREGGQIRHAATLVGWPSAHGPGAPPAPWSRPLRRKTSDRGSNREHPGASARCSHSASRLIRCLPCWRSGLQQGTSQPLGARVRQIARIKRSRDAGRRGRTDVAEARGLTRRWGAATLSAQLARVSRDACETRSERESHARTELVSGAMTPRKINTRNFA